MVGGAAGVELVETREITGFGEGTEETEVGQGGQAVVGTLEEGLVTVAVDKAG